jgi:DNA ligase-1
MLALASEDLAEVLDDFGEAAFEYKLDGARVQIHKDGSEVRVYTRRLNEITEEVPEIVEQIRGAPVRTLIADGEAIALQPDGTPRPFQITMRRIGRRQGVQAARETLPLTLFLFDALHVDGQNLIERPAVERFAALSDATPQCVVPRLVTSDEDRAAAFLKEALTRGHEGLMAKSLSSSYESGRRGAAWRKLKPFYSLDLVVLGAEWGHGRRHGWLSNLHLGARDPVTGSYVMLGKTFKGLTDEMLAWQTGKLLELEVARNAWTVYVRPSLVVEIAFNEVQSSPRYPAGLALRFARVKRYRPDKSPEEVDTVDTVQQIYARRAHVPEVSIRTV